MRLREGVTCNRNVSLQAFKSACYQATRIANGNVLKIETPGATPNYFRATIEFNDTVILILGNLAYPLIAFATAEKENETAYEFVDLPSFVDTFQQRDFQCLNAVELATPVSQADLSDLGESELRDIQYWKPRTVGEVIFNHWD